MKLKAKFSIIAIVASFQMAILVLFTFIGLSFTKWLTDYQYLLNSVQIGSAGITNYLNKTVSWAVDLTTIHTDWQKELVSVNKNVHQLAESNVTKLFPEEFAEKIDEAEKSWTKIVSKVNPFNNQFKTMQDTPLEDNIRGYISRNGIRAAHELYPDDENMEVVYSQQLLIHTQMRELMKEQAVLQNLLREINQILVEQLQRYQKIIYMIEIFVGAIFCGLIFVLIFSGTDVVRKNILKIRDFSSELAEKNFSNEISPSGSNEMQALMRNMNGMVQAINDFFIIVKKTAAKAISSGYSINDSATSTAAATNEINMNIESITKEFEQIDASVNRTVEAVDEINRQVEILVIDNAEQTSAIDESTSSIMAMAEKLQHIKDNAMERTKSAEEMRNLVADGDQKIASTTEILEDVMSKLDEIGEVITIINSVSEQTNLLSMNAAIESAHAGEYGKGFAVVAEEIRALAESTADNAQKINESITNIIKRVTEANGSSKDAASAFSKVSSHSSAVIDSFKEITSGIEEINAQTKQITQKTDVTASAADKINDYCVNLASQQDTISVEITSISNLFKQALEEIKGIQMGTEDIVNRMSAVGSLSKESYKNMTDLENVLEEFKTSSETDAEEKQEIEENTIQNVISPELEAQLAEDFSMEESSGEEVDFDPDSVTEY